MTAFWTMFWLGFIGLPLLVMLAMQISGKDSGFQKDTSHIWVFKGSHAKVKDATVRDVWEHNHPGQSWTQHQDSQVMGCSIVLIIAFLAFLYWLAALIFVLPIDRTGLRLFWQIGAPILGGISAAAFYGIQAFISNYKSGFLMILHVLALIVMGIGVIGGLVLTFLDKPLPISYHWVWVPAGLTVLFLILDKIFGGAQKKRAGKEGGELSEWVLEIIKMVGGWRFDGVDGWMMLAAYEVKTGKYDWKLDDLEFFKQTESLMLDLVRGRQFTIKDDEVYKARNEVIKTLQTIYFYSVEKFPKFSIHPKIKKALNQ